MENSGLKRIVKWIIAVLVIAILVVLCMGGFRQISFWIKSHNAISKIADEEAADILKNAEEITMEGDLNQEEKKTMIRADGELIGVMTETGGYESYWFQLGQGEQYHAEPYDEGPLREGLETAEGYVFYDAFREIAGYAQETLWTLPDGDERYVYMLYDADGNAVSCYLDTERYEICTMQGILLIKGSGDYNQFNHISTVKLVCKDDGEVDNLFKLLLAASMEKEAYQENID